MELCRCGIFRLLFVVAYLHFRVRFFQGAAIDRIVFEIIRSKGIPGFQFDYVMCLGHFLSKVLTLLLTLVVP